MDKKHLNTLEFPKILGQLAQQTSFSAGRDLALALEPSPVFAEVQQRLQETREARHLLDVEGGLALGGVHDIRPLAQHALRGAILQPSDLLNIQDTLRVGMRVRRTLVKMQGRVPLLSGIAARIEPCEGLAEEIGRCINDQGEVVDNASPKLAHVRRDLRTAYDRLMDRLNRVIANPHNGPFLQEALITQRSGRYVIPIRAEFKGRIPGIVHDSSASGATLFIEPLPVVELGNQWRQLQIEEQKEIDRILAELSAAVADRADELGWTVAALADLDLIMAKARYAGLLDATEPAVVPFKEAPRIRKSAPSLDGGPGPGQLHPGSTLDLRRARHPLLNAETVVPIDVSLGDECFILVITGPNTGGKTVTLKTVGLMVAMAQSGLHLPVAEGSALSVYEQVFADIGDEQSIEQSLSTFSSHLNNLIQILERAGEHSLLLLDELGAGTDPVEGSALARSILSHLLGRRLTTLVATHYSELKAFAHTTPGVQNASMEFDVETLSPTFKLRIGLPGRSNAFAIAERLGLSNEIVGAARVLVSPEEQQTESLLAQIQSAHREAAAARDEAVRARREAAEQQRRLATRLAAIEGERATILGEARAEAHRELARVAAELESLRAELAGQRSRGTLGEEWLAQARARITEAETTVLPPPPPPRPEEQKLPGKAKPGDTVWIASLGTTGQVNSLDGDHAEVQVGSFRVRVKQSELERRGRATPSEQPPSLAGGGWRASPGLELDLRGRRVEDILDELEKYIDDAFLAGLPFVRIIHGKGTGALRDAVRDRLRSHPLVKSYRLGEDGEGGSGVTVVYLRGE